MRSKTPLEAVVSAGVEADEIRAVPAAMTLLPGETMPIHAIGYKNGKSIGDVSGAGKVAWQSDNKRTVRIEGEAITALRPGEANVAARFGSLTSQPAKVKVVAAIADSLRTDPKTIRLRVGEEAQVGADVAVFRGDADVSQLCKMTSLRPGCVRCLPETRSLLGVSPGVSEVAFTLGDKLCNMTVEVAPAGGAIEGDVRVDPASVVLAPGQTEPLRVWVGSVDCSASAALASSDAKVAEVRNGWICAIGPGKAEITAKVPGAAGEAKAYVVVNDEEISELIAAPMRLAVGDSQRLAVLGRAACGVHEMFPQPDLKLSAGGDHPASIVIADAHQLRGAAEGEAAVDITWKGKLHGQADVTVTADAWSELRIEPKLATVHPGEALRLRGDRREGRPPPRPRQGRRRRVDRRQRQGRPGPRRTCRRRRPPRADFGDREVGPAGRGGES